MTIQQSLNFYHLRNTNEILKNIIYIVVYYATVTYFSLITIKHVYVIHSSDNVDYGIQIKRSNANKFCLYTSVFIYYYTLCKYG